MKIELHSHTHYSRGMAIYYDGVCSPEEMVRAASDSGLDAIAITDHDTMEAVKEAQQAGKKYGIMVIPGEEVSSSDGHILGLNISETIKPGLSAEETIDEIHSQGGTSIAPHPFDIKKTGIRELCTKTDAIESFNALNLDKLSNRKAFYFAKQNKLRTVASSDAHHWKMVGHGITETDADGIDNALINIKKGRTKLHTKSMPLRNITELAIRRLQMSYPYISDYLNSNYSYPKRMLATSMLKMVNHSPGPMDKVFNAMTYVSFGAVVMYSVLSSLK